MLPIRPDQQHGVAQATRPKLGRAAARSCAADWPSAPVSSSASSCPDQRAPTPWKPPAGSRARRSMPFVRIAPDDTVTVLSKHIEFGQGTYTGLATILAEELDADWRQVRVDVGAGGRSPLTPISPSASRAPAAAPRWPTPGRRCARPAPRPAPCWSPRRPIAGACRQLRSTSKTASSTTGQRTVGELRRAGRGRSGADSARKADAQGSEGLPLIGKKHLPRVDVPAKSDGTAVFTLDRAAGAHRPRRPAAALRRHGQVVRRHRRQEGERRGRRGAGADRRRRAGRELLGRQERARRAGVEWDDRRPRRAAASELFAEYEALCEEPGMQARSDGDARRRCPARPRCSRPTTSSLSSPTRRWRPLDCVIQLGQAIVRGLGRLAAADRRPGRGRPASGCAREGVGPPSWRRQLRPPRHAQTPTSPARRRSIAKASADARPGQAGVDPRRRLRGGSYRPLYVHRLRAGLDAGGKLVAWDQRSSASRSSPARPSSGLVQTASTRPRSRARRPCPTASPTSGRACTPRRSGVPVCGGARWATRTTASRTETFSTSWPAPAAATRSTADCELLAIITRDLRGARARAPTRPDGASPRPPAGARRRASTSRSSPSSPRWPRSARQATGCPRSSAWSAPSTAASPSIPTTSRRRWRAASATASAPRCTTRSRSRRASPGQQLPRLPQPAHPRDAEGRGPRRAVGRGADRRRRARSAAHRPGRRQCLEDPHRPLGAASTFHSSIEC